MARAAEATGVRRFTVDEYHRMVDAGILREDDRVELIYGVIREMSPKNRPHIFRDPEGGSYQTRTTHEPGSRIEPVSWPGFEIDVDSLFPSEASASP